MGRRLGKNLIEVLSTVANVLSLRYPGFVYGGGVSARYIPVFCLHAVDPEMLESMLSFLDSNGYTTLDADEYYAALTGQTAAPKRSVVLTFDDGWGSLWSVGYPILKRHGAKIVVFIAPGRIERRDGYHPNLDDLAANRCTLDELLGRDKSDQPLLTWEEIFEMHESGLVDFQSHSYNHSLIYRSPRVVEYVSPDLLKTHSIMELPCRKLDRPAGMRPPVDIGEPLYETAPMLSDTLRLIVDPWVAETCAKYVHDHGGDGFFHNPRWREELDHVTYKLLSASKRGWRIETEREHADAIHFDLAASKSAIEEMLPGKLVRHLCYPWHVAGEVARRQSREVGYATNFWGKIGGRYYTPIPGSPDKIARVGADFFFRLPGKGRVDLFKIFLGKVVRRAREGTPYVTH